MKINLTAYQEHYHDKKKGKLIDNWQEGIKFLPFTSNPTSAIDKGAGLVGVTGAFFRLLSNEEVQPFEDFKKAESNVKSYLETQRRMKEAQAEEFACMFRDIMIVNGALNVTDTALLKYIPLVPNDDLISEKDRKKYKAGQMKCANLLATMIPDNASLTSKETTNLFTRLLKEALTIGKSKIEGKKKLEEEYYILPFVQEAFNRDFKWMMGQESSVVIRYIHLLLHFYVCYIVLQTLPRLSYRQRDSKNPINYYYMLNEERASSNHDAVLSWKKTLPKDFLDRIYGRSQALDILNCVLGKKVGFYPEIEDLITKTPFEDNKSSCEELLRLYQKEKHEVFSNRSSESGSIEEIDVSLNSYDDFFEKLEILCKGLQSPSYVSRMRKKIIDLLSIRFLQKRRENYVLTLDNEMLVFLIAMITKGQRVKLETMYKGFSGYGISFNRGTRNLIESHLLKLNLLDRKSDSGEAQYVKVIL